MGGGRWWSRGKSFIQPLAVISITISEALGEVRMWGICLKESGLGSEGIFCDLSVVDTPRAETLDCNMSVGSNISPVILTLIQKCLNCFFYFIINRHTGIFWKLWASY